MDPADEEKEGGRRFDYSTSRFIRQGKKGTNLSIDVKERGGGDTSSYIFLARKKEWVLYISRQEERGVIDLNSPFQITGEGRVISRERGKRGEKGVGPSRTLQLT